MVNPVIYAVVWRRQSYLVYVLMEEYCASNHHVISGAHVNKYVYIVRLHSHSMPSYNLFVSCVVSSNFGI